MKKGYRERRLGRLNLLRLGSLGLFLLMRVSRPNDRLKSTKHVMLKRLRGPLCINRKLRHKLRNLHLNSKIRLLLHQLNDQWFLRCKIEGHLKLGSFGLIVMRSKRKIICLLLNILRSLICLLRSNQGGLWCLTLSLIDLIP